MGIIADFLERRRQQKEEIKELQRHDKALEKLEQSKKTPMERELEKYNEQDRQKRIMEKVLKERRERKYQAEMQNTPINIKPIFKDDKNLFNSKNIFMKKVSKPQKSIFVSENIFAKKIKRR